MLGAVLLVYLVLHIPAIIMLVLGVVWRKSRPKTSKTLLILAVVYFLVGAGICGSMFT